MISYTLFVCGLAGVGYGIYTLDKPTVTVGVGIVMVLLGLTADTSQIGKKNES